MPPQQPTVPNEDDIIDAEITYLPLKEQPPLYIGEDVVDHQWNRRYPDGYDDDDDDEDVPYWDDDTDDSAFPSHSGYPQMQQTFPHRGRLAFLALVLLLVLLLLGVVASLFSGINPFSSLIGPLGSNTTAYVTVTPEQRVVTLHPTLSLSQIRGIRLVPKYTLEVGRTQPASGVLHLPATVASGALLFYNAGLSPVSLPSGYRLTSSTGYTVELSQSVTVPASYPPEEGYASASAHAVSAGTQGNMRAGLFAQGCCGFPTLLVENAAFIGGQNAQTVSVVEASDVSGVQTQIQAQLQQQKAAHQTQELEPGESLLSSLSSCTLMWTWVGHPGSHASQVQGTGTETCQDVATRDTLFTLWLENYLTTQHLPASYETMQQQPQVQITRVDTLQQQVTLSITVSLAAEFDQGTLTTMRQAITGMSQKTAETILSTWPGMGKVSLVVYQQGKLDTQVLLPADEGAITMMLGASKQ